MNKYWAYVRCAAGLNFFSGQITITSHLAFLAMTAHRNFIAPRSFLWWLARAKSIDKCDTFVIKCDENGR